jgi:multiple sugar transport system permease protein
VNITNPIQKPVNIKSGRSGAKQDQRKILGYLYMVPTILIALVMIIYPIIYGVRTSFFQWNWSAGAEKITFIGFDNYIRVFQDQYFWKTLGNTLLFSFLAIVIEFILGLICALLLNSKIKGSLVFRTIMMFPLMLSDIVAALMWRMMLEPSSGSINQILSAIGLGTPNWLGDQSIVILTLVLVEAWWQTGNIIIILLSGLQSMPNEPMEMARIDGANSVQLFRFLIWPHLIPYAKTAITFRLIDLLRVFALAWAITGGGPVRSSEMSQLYIYTTGLGKYLNIGYSITMAIVFAIIVSLIVFIVNRVIVDKG